jgi:hypothetical protein
LTVSRNNKRLPALVGQDLTHLRRKKANPGNDIKKLEGEPVQKEEEGY